VFSGPGALNHIFRPRGPSNKVGDAFNCIWDVLCIEFAHGEFALGKIDATVSIDKIQTCSASLEVLLLTLRGEHIFEKRTPKQNIGPHIVISSNEWPPRVKNKWVYKRLARPMCFIVFEPFPGPGTSPISFVPKTHAILGY